MLSLTNKQKEFWNNANHRWNIKCGATRSGKTFLDYYLIPKRIRAVSGKDGLYVILGNTKSTLQRNIIEPLQNIWGAELVGDIKSDNTAILFGEKVHCIGADKVNQVNRLRGSSIKYCYGDEVVTWHKEVFDMLKSRLDKEYSLFDGTCNPDTPEHWFKKFLDRSDIDLFCQHYNIYDNTFLSPGFVKNLEAEYKGTVYFDRYINGLWVRAEGIVFPNFANETEKYYVNKEDLPEYFKWVGMGYDIGGNLSKLSAVAVAGDYRDNVYVLRASENEQRDMKNTDLERTAIEFIQGVENDYKCKIRSCYVDDNYYTTVNGLNDWRYIFDVAGRIKSAMPLIDRPIKLNRLINKNKFFIVRGECEPLVYQLRNAVYSTKVPNTILDDGSMNIDCIDALFYAMADEYHYLEV